MIKMFNALQFVALFSCMPYIIQWLTSDPISYANMLRPLAIIVYVIMFGMTIASVYSSMEKS